MLFKFKLVRLILGDILLISAFVLLLNTQAQAQNKGQRTNCLQWFRGRNIRYGRQRRKRTSVDGRVEF